MLGKAMLGDLLGWIGDEGKRQRPGEADELKLAVAALLVEAASADECFDAGERATIERLLAARYGLTPAQAAQLVSAGEAASERSVQLFGFTRTLSQRLTPAERVGVVEMLWEVAFADGALDPMEDTLLRRVAGLVDVSDRERGLARQRVEARLGRKNETEPRET
jgi:uncharacterized tellurite resistance protein B-like protein